MHGAVMLTTCVDSPTAWLTDSTMLGKVCLSGHMYDAYDSTDLSPDLWSFWVNTHRDRTSYCILSAKLHSTELAVWVTKKNKCSHAAKRLLMPRRLTGGSLG
jgi:hypothetical protein